MTDSDQFLLAAGVWTAFASNICIKPVDTPAKDSRVYLKALHQHILWQETPEEILPATMHAPSD